MFPNLAALQTALLEKDPKSFVSHYIFEPVPFAFDNDISTWIEWKRTLGEQIDVDPRDIVMTGSAATGYSLNPNKRFKPFDRSSDFDCGVVSDYYFTLAWRHLRQNQVSWLALSKRTRTAINSHRTLHIFAGTIATDNILGLLPFGKVWQDALSKMGRTAPTINRDVKLRIYKDFDALRSYQTKGIELLRNQIGGSVDSEIIEAGSLDDMLIEESE